MRSLEEQEFVHKNQCLYCCKNQDVFNLCLDCNTSVCDEHMTLHEHLTKPSHHVYCSSGNIYDSSKNQLNRPEYQELASKLSQSQDATVCLNMESLGINGANIYCSHRKEISATKTSPKPICCEECGQKTNIWICLTCGYMGCGRSNPGISEGNGHAAAHYEETKHPTSLKITSLKPESSAFSAEVYCYECDDFIVDSEALKTLANFSIKQSELVPTELTHAELMKNFFENSTEKSYNALTYKKNIAGIKNTGNTCYISSVIQSLYAIIPLREKVLLLEEEPSYDNLNYQIQRLFKGISAGEENIDVSLIQSIVAPNIFSSVGQIGMQQDAEEWFVCLCKATSVIGDFFKFDLKSSKTCLSCSKTFGETCVTNYIWTLNQCDDDTNLASLLDDSPGDFLDAKCEHCGEEGLLYSSYCEHSPSCVCFKTSRIAWDNSSQSVVKNTKKLSLPDSLRPENTFRDSPDLHFVSTVVHRGANYSSGHYIAFRQIDGKTYRFSDSVVSDEIDEEIDQSYLSFYIKS